MLVAVPNYIMDEINKRLDAAIAECPEAESSRDSLRRELLAYVDEHGVIPDFSLGKRAANDEDGQPTEAEEWRDYDPEC